MYGLTTPFSEVVVCLTPQLFLFYLEFALLLIQSKMEGDVTNMTKAQNSLLINYDGNLLAF